MRILIWVVCGFLGLMVLLLALIYFLPGWDLYTVKSNSMKPAFAAHDMIITRPVPSQVKPGNVIAFRQGGKLITHRVVSVNGDSIITKGDANASPDPQPISRSQIKGVYFLKIPYLGHLTSFMGTKTGWFLLILLPAAVVVGLLVRGIIKEAMKDDKSNKKPVPPSQ
ncbi:MAG: signal peptidase I [Chloroflexi bacterium]|nr:signal peptidase I [Chloroflexota bacterium]